jgi:SAM-dependent methyltransferase
MTEISAARSGVFDGEQAQTLLGSDQDHWWFQSKSSIVAGLINRHLPRRSRNGWLVDLGAGAGGVTSRLGWCRERTIALDGFTPMVTSGRQRHQFRALVGNLDAVPMAGGTADVVTLLDVIEHQTDPSFALMEARRIVRADGILIVTVPAHQWLWSQADELLGHVKRYDRGLLRSELESCGFEVRECGHVFSWLVPPVWLRRRTAKDSRQQLGLDAGSPAFGRVAGVLTEAEQRLTRRVSLPIGTTVMAVARPR